MIYLIDDSDLKELDAEYVFNDKYKDILCVVRDISEFESQKTYMADSKCLMIHLSFNQSNVYESVEKIADYGKKIPFVCFSGGGSERGRLDNEKCPHSVDDLSKSSFYRRLPFFLEYFKKNQDINLMLLALGRNYKSIYARDLALEIMRETFNIDNNIIDSMSLNMIMSKGVLKKLIEISSLSYDDIIISLQDKPMTIEHFRYNINKIVDSFNQYGENIYIWK